MNDEKRRNIFFILTMFFMSIYLVWRLLFTLPFGEGTLNMIFGVLLIMAEIITVLTTFELFIQKIKKESTQLECPDIPPEYYPHVDVFIATHNEPVELLYKTVNACTYMDYPDKKKVHIYICDDSDRLEVAELAKQLGVGYLGIRDNKDAKSGNLNNALSKTSSPLIATFDADMIPQHTFLMKTVPYFLLSTFIKEDDVWRLRTEEEIDSEWKLGLVQTPQSFYNPDLFQFNLYAEKNIPNEQDFFSKEINILRNNSNAVAYTGSNTVIARHALEEINGFPLDTITEDFETSIRLQQAGYITYATDHIQAAGLSTTTVEEMVKQRVRWARGIIQSLQNTRAIFSSKLSFAGRITYLNSFLYCWSFFNRLIFILSPILFALFDFKIVNTGFWEILFFWLPSYLFYSIAMRYLSNNIRNQQWSQVVDTIFMPYLIIPVLLETLHIHEKNFKVTDKNKSSNNQSITNFGYALPHIFLLLLSIIAVFRFTYGKYGWALFYSSIILFWLLYNIVSLCYALFFMLGRHSYRQSERIQATEIISIQYDDQTYEGLTMDVSDQGLAFYVSSPIYLPEEDIIYLTIQTERYEANLEGAIVYVRNEGNGWRYSTKVSPVEEADRREYMQIIYDRQHSLPKRIDLWVTVYDDIVRNIEKRVSKPFKDRRKLPRIPIYYPVIFENGSSCVLKSFNYRYFSASDFVDEDLLDTELRLVTKSKITVILRRTGITMSQNKEVLFSVENLENLVEQNLIEKLLEDLGGNENEYYK